MAGFSFHHFAGLFRRRMAQKGEAENHHQINSFWISLCLIQWSFIAFQQMVYFPSPLAHTSAKRHTLLPFNKLPRQEKNLSPWIYRWFHSRCEASRQSISNTGRHRAQVSSHINHNAWIGNDKTDAVCFLIIGLLDCDTNKHNIKPWISTNKSSNAVLMLWRFWSWKVCERGRRGGEGRGGGYDLWRKNFEITFYTF